jgi:hypothetical protein
VADGVLAVPVTLRHAARMFPDRVRVRALKAPARTDADAGDVPEYDAAGPELPCKVTPSGQQAVISGQAEASSDVLALAFPADPGVRRGDLVDWMGRVGECEGRAEWQGVGLFLALARVTE